MFYISIKNFVFIECKIEDKILKVGETIELVGQRLKCTEDGSLEQDGPIG